MPDKKETEAGFHEVQGFLMGPPGAGWAHLFWPLGLRSQGSSTTEEEVRKATTRAFKARFCPAETPQTGVAVHDC